MAASGPQPPSSPPSLPAPPLVSPAAGHPPAPAPSTPRGLQQIWQKRGIAAWALWPVSLIYGALVLVRRSLYRAGLLKAEHPGRPVVVVGNVIAGGAGKTPVVIAIVRHLQDRGLRPGVISRGYGRNTTDCRAVTPDSLASEVGDEPLLMARSFANGPGGAGQVPVFVAPRRITAAQALLAAHPDTDVIVCDDGLQHMALQRDLEICIFNDQGIGNGFLLPAGPLREPWPRTVDLVLHAGHAVPGGAAPAFAIQRALAPFALRSDGTEVPLANLHGQPLHAVAAVARPEDFFAMLVAQGLTLAHTEPLPDHYDFNSWKRLSEKRYTLICTEKDAVKLWAQHPDALAVPLQLHLDPAFVEALGARLGIHTAATQATQLPPLSSPPV